MNDDDKKNEELKEEQSDEFGDTDVSGEMPDPESDDDVGENAKKVGLYNDNEGRPEEVDLAGKVEEAERIHQKED